MISLIFPYCILRTPEDNILDIYGSYSHLEQTFHMYVKDTTKVTLTYPDEDIEVIPKLSGKTNLYAYRFSSLPRIVNATNLVFNIKGSTINLKNKLPSLNFLTDLSSTINFKRVFTHETSN